MKRTQVVGMIIVGVLLQIGGLTHASGMTDAEGSDNSSIILKSGTLEPASGVDLRNDTGRRATVLFVVPQGKSVKEGTLLVELDASSLERQKANDLDQAARYEADIAAAKLSLSQVKETSRAQVKIAELRWALAQGALDMYTKYEHPMAVANSEREISLAEAKVARVAEQREKLKQLKETPDTKRQKRAVEADWAELQAGLATLQAKSHLVKTMLHQQKTTDLQLALAEKELELIRSRHQLVNAETKVQTKLDGCTRRLEVELKEVARVEEQIEACKIYAPRDGRVLYQRSLRRSMTVSNEEVLLRVVDQDRFVIDVQVALPITHRMATGQSVSVYVDAFPGRAFSGRLTRMRVLSDPPQKDPSAMLTIRLEDPSGKVRKGMSATVEFKLKANKIKVGN